MSTRPRLRAQRKAAYVPPKSTLPFTMLSPTTVEPSAETPHASLCMEPPGRSPNPMRVGWARAAMRREAGDSKQRGAHRFMGSRPRTR